MHCLVCPMIKDWFNMTLKAPTVKILFLQLQEREAFSRVIMMERLS